MNNGKWLIWCERKAVKSCATMRLAALNWRLYISAFAALIGEWYISAFAALIGEW